MTIYWRLKDVLLERHIQNAGALSKALKDTLGISISPQALLKLMQDQPTMLRLETAQYLCTLLNEPLSALLEITPDPPAPKASLIQPFGKKPYPNDSIIISPEMFF